MVRKSPHGRKHVPILSCASSAFDLGKRAHLRPFFLMLFPIGSFQSESPRGVNRAMRGAAGFSLIEVLIALVIIGLLAAVALPQYQSFIGRSAYAEVILAAKVYRRAVEVCALENPMASCDSGTQGIPLGSGTQAVSTIAVVDGVITVTPKTYKTITPADIYVLTPVGGGGGTAITQWNHNCATHAFC